jgi:D-alanine-D-alanine ligase
MPRNVLVLLADPRIRDYPSGRNRSIDLIALEKMHTALSELTEFRFEYLNEHRTLTKVLSCASPMVVLNLCNFGFRNDPQMRPHIPALLDILGIPYSGSDAACLAKCHDRAALYCVAEGLGVPVPRAAYVRSGSRWAARRFEFPALVAPCYTDGTVDFLQSRVIASADELHTHIAEVRDSAPTAALMVQDFLPGPEYSVGIIGNPTCDSNILPIVEVCPAKSDHSPRYAIRAGTEYREAKLSPVDRRRLGEYARLLFERMGCRDYVRVDFRASSSGEFKVVAVKPNPAWSWDGRLARMLRLRGQPYSEMFRLILETALFRSRLGLPSTPCGSRACGAR